MGAKKGTRATWSGLSAGGHFHVCRKSLSAEQRDGRGGGARPVPTEAAPARRAGAADKDNAGRGAAASEGRWKTAPGRNRPRASAEWGRREKREPSVCLFGLRPPRNHYSLLITICRKETRGARASGTPLPPPRRKGGPRYHLPHSPSQRIRRRDPRARLLFGQLGWRCAL